MTDKIQKIREEIEKLHKEYRNKKGAFYYRKALRTVLFLIDSLQKESVSNDFEMALAEMIGNAQTSVIEPWVVAAQWKDELIKLAKSEEPVSSVWHEKDKEPCEDRQVLVCLLGNCYVDFYHKEDKRFYMFFNPHHYLHEVDRWAYIDDILNLSNVERTTKNWKEPVSERFAFKAIPRLLEMIEPTGRAKAYIAKLADALEVEGYSTDAKIVMESLKIMNGEKVPMATMDEEPVSGLDNGDMPIERWKQAVEAASNQSNYRRSKGLTETEDDYFVDGVQWADEHPKEEPKTDWLQELQERLDSLSKEDFKKVFDKYVIDFNEEPVNEDLEKIVEEIAEPTILNAYGTKELARRLRNTICGTSVSEDLEEASKEWLIPQLDKSYANYGETKMMELTHFDGYAMLDAIEFGVKWKEQQFEKNRLKHCNSITNEQAELEQGFIDQHLDKYNRMPTFLDAIEYGMSLQKEQMMAKAIDGEVGYWNLRGLSVNVELPRSVNEGDKVKVIVIKEG